MNAFTHYAPTLMQPHHLDPEFPTDLWAWSGKRTHGITGVLSTGYGYVHAGKLRLTQGGSYFDLTPGMYFSAPAPFTIHSPTPDGAGVLLLRHHYHGVVHVGGPIEAKGRLRYIDGCTDSLLIPPQRRGEPCLNLLQFPPGIDQTAHTHPSARAGMIVSGRGRCVADGVGEVDLIPGMAFCIHPGGVHKFQTPYGVEMRVVAFHPDSDFGPTDEDHPMLNRTIVDKVSARDLPHIRSGADTVVEFEQ
jgi:quercetin dioxygenase-like cupin family protein